MKVFFYGLFMDEELLADKGVRPSGSSLAFLDNRALRIGERATLVHRNESRVYGVLMDVTASEVANLYAEKSVADYIPERVTATLLDGAQVEASSYILPDDQVTGKNEDYAMALHDLAVRLGFPGSYLDELRGFIHED